MQNTNIWEKCNFFPSTWNYLFSVFFTGILSKLTNAITNFSVLEMWANGFILSNWISEDGTSTSYSSLYVGLGRKPSFSLLRYLHLWTVWHEMTSTMSCLCWRGFSNTSYLPSGLTQPINMLGPESPGWVSVIPNLFALTNDSEIPKKSAQGPSISL